MHTNRVTTVLCGALIGVLFFGCSRTPEERFTHAVEKYNRKQDAESRLVIENNFLTDLQAVKLNAHDDYLPGVNAIILKDGDISTVITSDGYSEPWNENIRFAHYDPATSTLCISDGFSAEFFTFSTDEDGTDHISRERELYLTKDDETAIDSMYIFDDTLFFYYKRQLHAINLVSENKKIISRKDGKEITAGPPYDKFAFKVYMAVDGTHVALAVGDAGMYSLYVFDHVQSVLVFQKKVPSRFFSLNGDRISYLAGKTGNWQVNRIDLGSTTEKTIRSFSTLRDIAVSTDRIFYVDQDGYHITDPDFLLDYAENPMAKIDRIVNDYLVIEFRGEHYFVSTPLYFTITNRYESLVPNFFKHNPGLTADDLK